MNIKSFLLGLDKEILCQTYYDLYYRDNDVHKAEARLCGFDPKESIFSAVKLFLSQIETVNTVQSDNRGLVVMKCVDTDFTDDLEMIRREHFDCFMLNAKETKDRGPMVRIENLQESIQEPILSSYSLTFTPWEEILGYEPYYLYDHAYYSAAAIINEMTFFGYEYEDNKAKVEDAVEQIEEAQKEIDCGAFEGVDLDELREKFNLPTKTREQEERERALSCQIAIENYNMRVDLYNELNQKGLFRKT